MAEIICASDITINMESGPRPISDLVADEYAGRILSCTFSEARCVQEISALTGIPIAMAYRRVAVLESAGLVKCLRTEDTSKGRRIKYYLCQVEMVRLTFRNGHFEVEIEWKDQISEKHLPVMTRQR